MKSVFALLLVFGLVFHPALLSAVEQATDTKKAKGPAIEEKATTDAKLDEDLPSDDEDLANGEDWELDKEDLAEGEEDVDINEKEEGTEQEKKEGKDKKVSAAAGATAAGASAKTAQ